MAVQWDSCIYSCIMDDTAETALPVRDRLRTYGWPLLQPRRFAGIHRSSEPSGGREILVSLLWPAPSPIMRGGVQ